MACNTCSRMPTSPPAHAERLTCKLTPPSSLMQPSCTSNLSSTLPAHVLKLDKKYVQF